MIVEKFAALPPWISYDGVNFELQLINDGKADDNRLVYVLSYVFDSSQHYKLWKECGSWVNPFNEGSLQGFLWLAQGIETDDELIVAIDRAKAFLQKNNLWTD